MSNDEKVPRILRPRECPPSIAEYREHVGNGLDAGSLS